MLCSKAKRYTVLNVGDEAILSDHFYRGVIEKPKPTEKQPTRDESSNPQPEQPLDNDSPADPPKPKMKSRELAGLGMSLGDGGKPPAEGSHWNRAGKNMLAESEKLDLEDEEFENMIPIYAAAAISKNHDDQEGIDDPNYYKGAIESPLAERWDTTM